LETSNLNDSNEQFGKICQNNRTLDSIYNIDVEESDQCPIITEYMVITELMKLKKTATSPDGIPHWLLHDNVIDLAPVLT
jgi:hypothetical protein